MEAAGTSILENAGWPLTGMSEKAGWLWFAQPGFPAWVSASLAPPLLPSAWDSLRTGPFPTPSFKVLFG